MSHRSTGHRRQHHASGAGSHGQAAVAVLAADAPMRRADYTIAHAGHQLRLGPIAFWIVVGTLVIMAGWTIVTATYFAFRDDVLTRLIKRQAEIQFGYEDRIAEMRAQVDRVTSRQLLDQEQFEQKLDQVLRRQTALERRAATLGGLADPAITGAIRQRAPVAGERPETTPPKPSPISERILYFAPVQGDPQPRLLPASDRRSATDAKAGGIEGVLTRLHASLDRVELSQTAALNSMEERYDATARRMHGVLADLGVNVAKARGARGVGGPMVVVKRGDANAFQRQLYRISLARAQIERLTDTLRTVPVRKPIAGDVDLSSGFGVRIDPFLGRPAMHTGLDFRGSTGERVFATAAGTVISAGRNGGYGKMVEISHGHGITTRYGHLSRIEVAEGDKVSIGQTIGRVGSTGRSTGPHLHYETRIDDDAVDPQKFLRAGVRLGGRH
jgi:murein DD-endopeptidase MepM/ murein hydrolase activator NlpD